MMTRPARRGKARTVSPNVPGVLAGDHELELGVCPACSSGSRTLKRTVGDLFLQLCRDCGLIYLDPQPVGRVSAAWMECDLAGHYEPWSKRKRILYERRLNEVGPPIGEANRLCDVGCGDGQFLELAAAMGWDPSGVEPNPSAASRARERGARVWEDGFESLDDLPWRTFDLVTAWDSLEHTPTPREFATRMSRLARPGGRLALSTLNASSVVARVFGARWSMIDEGHYTYWHPPSLQDLVESSGWTDVRARSLGIGRDFIRWLETAIGRFNRSRRGANRRAAVTSSSTSDWGTSRAALGLEEIVNRVLGATNAGVSLEVFARATRDSSQ
jgi:SAM-dependent methyltransferase